MKHSSGRWLVMGLLVAGLLLASGCAFKGDGVGLTRQGEQSAEDGSWQPTPASLRVYPSSKFARVDAQLIVEARLELLDGMGDPIKSSGLAQIHLATTGKASGKAEEVTLYAWDIELATLADQKTYYDPITRTYLFRLKLDQPDAPQTPTKLRATFTLPAGQRLAAEMLLPVVR